MMRPAAKKMTETKSQRTPHACGGPPTSREKAEASDSSTLRKTRSSATSQTLSESGERETDRVSRLYAGVDASYDSRVETAHDADKEDEEL